jgi:hypothetical protein
VQKNHPDTFYGPGITGPRARCTVGVIRFVKYQAFIGGISCLTEIDMRSMILAITTSAATALFVMGQQGETDQVLQAVYTDLSAKTGKDYLEARKRLLALDKEPATAFLESKRDTAADVLNKLLVQALLTHVRGPGKLDKQLDLAIQAATQPAWTRRGLDKNPRPRPEQVASEVIYQFKDDAIALATEMVMKKLTQDWEPWRREVPIMILSGYGRSTEHFVRTGETRIGDVKDARAGRVLLWVVEHEDDDKIAALATRCLYRYATPELIAQASTARQHAQTARNKEQLAEAIATMEAMQREVDENARYWATRPSSAPATQPKP